MEVVSLTSLSIAAQRAIESDRTGALFRDPFARRLAGSEGFRVAYELAELSRLPMSPEFPSMFAVRTRFYDDRVVAAVADGIRQVVVVAAGMDTRAYRLDWPPDTDLFEIDRPEAFDYKEPILADLGATSHCRRHVVAADLRENWPRRLLDAGFLSGARTAWVVEGLLYYLTESAVHSLLENAARLCPPHSLLYTDVAPTAMRDLQQLQEWRAAIAAFGEPWQFFTDDGASLLTAHGWDATPLSIQEVATALGIAFPMAGSLGARRLLFGRRRTGR
jgi:methyltransferase (TIGR00027 family)